MAEPYSLEQAWKDTRSQAIQAKKPVQIAEYDDWYKTRDPKKLRGVVTALEPTISAALNAYAGGSQAPTVRHRANVLAAKAVQGYDPNKGAQLHTHVMNQLRALQRLAPNITDPLALPEKFRRDQGHVQTTINVLTDTLGREPTDEEVADETRLPVRRVTKVRNRMRARLPFSALNADVDDGEDDESPEAVVSERRPEDDWMDAVYHDLGDIDRMVMQYRSGYRGAPILSSMEIASKLNLSPAVVSQRASRIQKKLDSFYG